MTPTAEGKLTVDDLRQQAEKVRDVATEEVRSVVKRDTTTYVIVGVIVFAVALSVAYQLGFRRAGRRFHETG